MKAYYLLNVFAFLLFGCAQLNDERLLDIKKIKVKSVVLDDDISYELYHFCNDDNYNTIDGCYYKVDNEEHVKLHSYVFNEKGSLNEFYKYLPEGPLTYNLQDLQKDKIFTQHYKCFSQNIKVYSNFIIDNKDTIIVYKIFKNPNLILADKSNFKQDTLSGNTMVIYEY